MANLATLYLDQLKCYNNSTENSSDDVFVYVFVDDESTHRHRWPSDGTASFDPGDHSYMNLALTLDYSSKVRIELWERDDKHNDMASDSVKLAVYNIDRRSATEGWLKGMTGNDKNANYEMSYRIITNPIKTLRIHGLKCEHGSKNCNADAIMAVAEATATCADLASEAMSHVKTPKAVAMSKGFEAVSKYIVAMARLEVFMSSLREGKDEIYLQQVDSTNAQDLDGVFCPLTATEFLKMDDGDEIAFLEKYGHYFRFPLDRGSVTIQLREGDRFNYGPQHNVALGAITISSANYDALASKGATVAPFCEYYTRGNGQGAIYYLCYSVAMEDWVLPATDVAQG